MAKPYLEGATWSFRLRIKKQDIYRSGFPTESAAAKAIDLLRHALTEGERPAHEGPWRTCVAQALQDYAVERLPFLKGARQEADRINRYLRLAGLGGLRIGPVPSAGEDGDRSSGAVVYYTVSVAICSAPRIIPCGLSAHRSAQAAQTSDSDRLRRQLATTPMAEVAQHQIQALVDAMGKDGSKAATIGLERALLRRLFNYAGSNWRWPKPVRNPATKLTLPPIQNERTRVLSNDEWRKLCAALAVSRSPYVAPALAVLLETAMRSSEALLRTLWSDVDFERSILRLRMAKAGGREVPLTPGAIAVLEALRARAGTPDPSAQVFPITYETLKAAWNRACERAGVTEVNIHDLRHTAATRFSLEYHGNMPVLKVITGHKTFSQLLRYINIKPDDVVRLMHGRPLTEGSAPAGYIPPIEVSVCAPTPAAIESEVEADVALPTNVVRFVRKKA